MALYRKIKGQDTKVADNGIIDHSQLSGRSSMNAHPISAIRKLPEKLTELKNKSIANQEAITQEIYNREQAIASEVEARNEAIAQEAQLRESADTNLSNNINNVRSATERINLEEDQVNRGKLIFTPAVGDPITVQGGFLPDNTSIILTQANQLQAKGLVTQTGYLSGDVIKEVISAQGGYLDSHDFGTSTPTNQELTDYAIQNIGTITQADEIWDKTRVINLYNHHTWVWDLSSKTWSDLGKIAQISDANNDGLHGLVTGAPNDGDHDYMGNIDANGQININGLPELAQQVENNTNNISINAQNISTNTSDIATNAASISNNTTAINNEITNRELADQNLQDQINNKQDILTAGDNIKIQNNVISAITPPLTLIGSADPTTATVGKVGQFYLNTTTNKLFQCRVVSEGSYTWGVPNEIVFDNTPTQNSQNAVTSGGVKSYVDDSIATREKVLNEESHTIQTTDWQDLSSSEPYKFSATITATYTIGNDTEVGTINDQPVLFGNYGFVVGALNGQSVTIYAVKKPETSVTLLIGFRG